MVLPIGKLCTNINFLLKIAVLVIGVSAICLDWPVLRRLKNGHQFGYLTIITALLITYTFFESTKTTEKLLLAVALVISIQVTILLMNNRNPNSNLRYYLDLGLNIVTIIIILMDIILLEKYSTRDWDVENN